MSKHEINHSLAFRPVVMGRNGMVSSGHHLASLAGVRIMEEGGNAVDAALATSFVLAVVKPEACGLGGDLFALVHMSKGGKVEALNASGPAPSRATIENYRAKGLKAVPTEGPLSIALPGAVDGWMELHAKYATRELARLAADAMTYAGDGFPLYRALGKAIAELAPEFPDVEKYFREPLGDLKPGRVFTQSGVALALEQIVKHGRKGFYDGDVARRMCAAIQAKGGLIREDDLHGKFAEWVEPLSTTYRDYLVYEQPPVSQGFMVLEMLNIVEGFPLDGMDPVEKVHVMVEAKKLAFEDRINHLEDPRFGDPQIAKLISKEYAHERRDLVSPAAEERRRAAGSFGSDTTYLCAVDHDGNAVSLIQSIFAGFGSRVVAGDMGIVMNNRLCSFGLDPEKVNALAPGKRPAHTLNSYMVFQNGAFLLVGGTPGADDQPQTNLQVLHHLLDLHMDPQSAIEAPRWSHQPGTPPRHEAPEELKMEEGTPSEVVDGLRRKGHPVVVVDRLSFGGANVIVRDHETGTLMGGADARRPCYAIGW
ncbi:MAG: gamma-glutamyltransferase [Candidatus Binatia bacterium]